MALCVARCVGCPRTFNSTSRPRSFKNPPLGFASRPSTCLRSALFKSAPPLITRRTLICATGSLTCVLNWFGLNCLPARSVSEHRFVPPPMDTIPTHAPVTRLWCRKPVLNTGGLKVIDKRLWHLCLYDWAATMTCLRHLPRWGHAVKPHVALSSLNVMMDPPPPISPIGPRC